MKEHKGGIDVALAQQFLADHEDSYTHKHVADGRTLCGHVDTDKEGIALWDWPPYYPGGAVQGKVTTSDMAAAMSFSGHAGHPCGQSFFAKPFLAAHPEYAWMSSILRDMKSGPWTTFTSGERGK
jgi:hypothetical protein